MSLPTTDTTAAATAAPIAARQYLSPETVHNHVSNTLRKLRVRARGEAMSGPATPE